MPETRRPGQQTQKTQEPAVAEVTGSSGGGLVTATVSGAAELKALSIDPKAVDPEDTETLADLVVAAVRDASANAQKLQQDKMGPLAGGLGGMMGDTGLGGLSLPGM